MSVALPASARVVEVGPRDGLQNEAVSLPVDERVRFVRMLLDAGLPEIEVGSFVSPRWVPQMADTERVVERLPLDGPARLTALVPNEKGMRRALASGVRSVAVFTAASETFNRKNTNIGIEGSLARFLPVIELARAAGIRVRGYVSTAFACPYEGPIAPERTVDLAARLFAMGVDEVSIGDTIGVATPRDVERFFDAARARLDPGTLAFHFHDTRGTALANVLVAAQHGVQVFDASAGGLGGCPYAPGASGNLATEDLVYLLEGMGIATGVDLAKLADTSRWIEERIRHPLPSKVYRAMRACSA